MTIETLGSTVTPYYNHTDHLNSIIIVSDTNKNIAQTLDYYPYGKERIITPPGDYLSQRQYIGQVHDQITGLDYLNARYYKAERGQFISQDPVFWEVGQTEDGKKALLNPQSQNSYGYAGNNPVTYSDPQGRITGIPWMDIAIGVFAPSVAYSPSVGEENQTNYALERNIMLIGLMSPTGESKIAAKEGQMLFRTMKEGVDGMPLVGNENVSQLGARLGRDIMADAKGMVHPNTGGVSISPDSPLNIPKNIRSTVFGGESKNPTWCISCSSLPKGTRFVQDSIKHGTIQPSFSMPVAKFNNLIKSTKSLWTKVK